MRAKVKSQRKLLQQSKKASSSANDEESLAPPMHDNACVDMDKIGEHLKPADNKVNTSQDNMDKHPAPVDTVRILNHTVLFIV